MNLFQSSLSQIFYNLAHILRMNNSSHCRDSTMQAPIVYSSMHFSHLTEKIRYFLILFKLFLYIFFTHFAQIAHQTLNNVFKILTALVIFTKMREKLVVHKFKMISFRIRSRSCLLVLTIFLNQIFQFTVNCTENYNHMTSLFPLAKFIPDIQFPEWISYQSDKSNGVKFPSNTVCV